MKRTFLMTWTSIIVLFYGMSCFQFKSQNASEYSKENSTKNSQVDIKNKASTSAQLSSVSSTMNQNTKEDALTLEQKMFKERKTVDQLKFAASLEKEVLKVLLSEDQQRNSQFEIIAFALEQFLNIKSGQLVGYECQKLNVVQSGDRKFLIKSFCLKQPKTLAEIIFQAATEESFIVRFFTKEWQAVIGTSAQLVGGDRECVFKVVNKKIEKLTCDRTVFNTTQSSQDISLQDIRIKTFEYSRSTQQEVLIEGGFFKDMIEIKKIKLTVPIIGKIKYEEKKLKIKDDFADMQKKLLGENSEPKNDEKLDKKNTPKPQQQETVNYENQNQNQNATETPTQNPNSGVIDSNSPNYER